MVNVVSLIFWYLFSYVLIRIFKTDIYKVIIGVGTFALALAFASSIARDATMVTQMSALADRAMMKARSVDSQQQTTRKLVSTRFIAERRS